MINLPLARDKTYVDGVTSVDAEQLNNDQDMVTIGAHGSIDEIFRFDNAVQNVGVWPKTSPGLLSPVGAAELELPLVYPVGTTITNIEISFYQDTSATIQFELIRYAAASAGSTPLEVENTTADTGEKTHSLVVDHAIQAGFIYAIRVTSTNDSNNVWSAKVSYHKDA